MRICTFWPRFAVLFRDPDQNAHLVGALIKKTTCLFFSTLKVLLAIPVLLCCNADLKIQMWVQKSHFTTIYISIFFNAVPVDSKILIVCDLNKQLFTRKSLFLKVSRYYTAIFGRYQAIKYNVLYIFNALLTLVIL